MASGEKRQREETEGHGTEERRNYPANTNPDTKMSHTAQGGRTPSLQELTAAYSTFVFDCDGVIWGIDPQATEKAVQVINHLFSVGKRVMFVTNNSNKRRLDFVKELESKKVDFGSRSEEEKVAMMISAAFTTASYLKAQNLKRPFVLTSDVGLLQELSDAGVKEYVATIDAQGKPDPDFESPLMSGGAPDLPALLEARSGVDSIVVGWDMGLTARKVACAINYIKWHEELHRDEADFVPMPLIAASGDAGGVLGTHTHGGRPVKIRAIGNGILVMAY